MKTETANSMGFEFPIHNLPSTVEEFDSMAQRQGACLDAAISQYVAHTHLTKVRAAIVTAVETATGNAREKTEEDGKVTYTETEASYVKRVALELEEDGKSLEDSEYLNAIVDAASAVTVDLTKAVRGAGTGSLKVPQKWIDAALEGVVKTGKTDAFAEKFELDLDGKDEDETLRIIGAKLRQISAEALRAAQAAALEI